MHRLRTDLTANVSALSDSGGGSAAIGKHKHNQCIICLVGTPMPWRFSSLLLDVLILSNSLLLFYILGSLRVCGTNFFVWEHVFVITTHPFVHHVFSQ